MNYYNLFKDEIPSDLKKKHLEQLAQRKAILDASNLIARAMDEAKISQAELAGKLGVTAGYVSRLMSGFENMTVKNVAGILYALGKNYIQSYTDLDGGGNKVITLKSNEGYTISGIQVEKRSEKALGWSNFRPAANG